MPLEFRVITQLHLVRDISLNCFALKPLLWTSYYTALSSYTQSKFLFHAFPIFVSTRVHLLPKLHKLTETTPLWGQPSHTILLPTLAPTKSRLSSQLSADSNCQQQPHVSSSLHPLTSSDKLQRELHLPVTFYLLHFTSQAHTAQH